MSEKKCPACPAGAPLWMVTFADLMALLLTLFVLLLTFSEMKIIKYKAAEGAIRDAFGQTRNQDTPEEQEDDGDENRDARRDVTLSIDPRPTTTVVIPEDESTAEYQLDTTLTAPEMAEDLEDAIADVLQNELENLNVELERSGSEVIIRFPSNIAFPSGQSGVNEEFAAIIDELAPIIQESQGDVVVSGHTDNVPLSGSSRFRSNWDLSAARATSVVHHLVDNHQMPLERLTVEGMGESRPLVDNDTSENRAKNRRVEISLDMSQLETVEFPGLNILGQ